MNQGVRVRVVEPERRQATIRFEMPEDSLPIEHPARVLWQVLGSLPLDGFVAQARAVEGHAGRPTYSPRMLLCLWLYAISQGVGSAREIARLLETDAAYRWIAGDRSVSHHVLSRFRVGRGEALDQLMTDVLGTLMHQGLLDLSIVAQDGTRVRASASAPSFRSEASLEQCLEQARLHLRAVLAQADDPELSARQNAAREAAARDWQHRIEQAITTVQTLRPSGKSKARASITDPEARIMKMGDGGFRPAYNLQLSVAGSPMGGPRTIVGLRAHNVGSDMSSVSPMLDEVERRTGTLPQKLLADANHVTLADIEDAAERGVRFVAPVPERMAQSHTSHAPVVEAWIADMATDDAKAQFRARASLCELANAHFKGRFGLDRVLVRGAEKVTCVGLLAAIAFNLLQHAPRLLG
jgi:transposase